MQFHNTITSYERLKREIPAGMSSEKFYEVYIRAHKGERPGNVPFLESELYWIRNCRPYYKVYPAILDALCRLKLDVKYECPDIPQNQISVRFAVGHEPRTKSGLKIGSILLSGGMGDGNKMMIISVDILDIGSETTELVINPNYEGAKSVEEMLELLDADPAKKEALILATRIALTVCMIEHDPDIITPEILSKDEQRYEGETEDWKRRAEERARQRGKVGWSIGKKFQDRANSPHYTNPHFAIRHTGQGRKTPKIVPVRGYWTGKEKLTEIPTGYILPNGTEVERGKIAS